MINLPHPIQYQGSKRNLVSDILRFLPNRVKRLVEPFSGTAAISIAVSNKDGREFPEELGLKKIEIEVGRSSQATLLGRQEITVESLYLSSNLSCDRNLDLESYISKAHKQITLLERH